MHKKDIKTIKDLKNYIKDLPDNMEVLGYHPFDYTHTNELNPVSIEQKYVKNLQLIERATKASKGAKKCLII